MLSAWVLPAGSAPTVNQPLQILNKGHHNVRQGIKSLSASVHMQQQRKLRSNPIQVEATYIKKGLQMDMTRAKRSAC